jgi:archaellum component FlaC
VCDAGEQAVEDLLDAIPGITEEVKDAAMQVVDEFYNKIGDVMEKFEAAVLRIEKQSVDDAKKLITLVEASIKNVTDHIVDKVEELISKSVSEITAACEAIIKDVSKLVDSIFSQVTSVLHDFEQFVWQALCTGEGMIKQLELFISASSMTKNHDDCECIHDAVVWAVDSCADSCTCRRDLFQPCRCSCGVSGWATVEDQNLYYAHRVAAQGPTSSTKDRPPDRSGRRSACEQQAA